MGLHVLLAAAITAACGSSSLPDGPPAPITDCGMTLTQCGKYCVDARVDPANCGGCGVKCAPSEACANGSCEAACFGGTTSCQSACVDLRHDPANCGFCANACSSNVACVDGKCATGCGSRQTACGSDCTDVATDRENCGACGVSCGIAGVCANGVCECLGSFCEGQCTDLAVDSAHCGTCNTACDGTTESCVAGKCVCAKGLNRCAGKCVDTTISMHHCGACGTSCALGEICDAGQCVASTNDWPTQGGDGFRDGVATNEVGRPPLTALWSVTPRKGVGIQPVAVGTGRIFVTYATTFASTSIDALELSDGSTAWSYPLGALSHTGFPTYANGRVVIVNGRGINGPIPRALAINATDGSLDWLADVAAQFEQYWSPLVVGDTVYSNAGTYGGLQAFDFTLGTTKFFAGVLEQFDRWSPTWSGSDVLTFVGGRLRAHSPSNGSVSWSTTVSTYPFPSGTYPVVGGGRAYIIASSNLFAIDLATHAVVWTGYGAYSGLPARVDDSVFGFSSGSLVVRNAATGTVVWSFVGDGGLDGAPVIANGFVYVASAKHTYAVDLTTHQQAWTTPVGGSLAIASRRLLIVANDTLHAYLMSK